MRPQVGSAALALLRLPSRPWRIWSRNSEIKPPTQAQLVRLSYTHANPIARSTGRYKLRRARLSRRGQDSTEPYSYISLPWRSSKIRLVEILPGEDVNIHFRMHIADLDSISPLRIDEKPRAYEALPYTWHSQALAKTILRDGRLLQVAHSLYEALYSLRRSTINRLWLDRRNLHKSSRPARTEPSSGPHETHLQSRGSCHMVAWERGRVHCHRNPIHRRDHQGARLSRCKLTCQSGCHLDFGANRP